MAGRRSKMCFWISPATGASPPRRNSHGRILARLGRPLARVLPGRSPVADWRDAAAPPLPDAQLVDTPLRSHVLAAAADGHLGLHQHVPGHAVLVGAARRRAADWR